MKYLVAILAVIYGLNVSAQADTLDVFIIEDPASEEIKSDSLVYDGVVANVKCDVAKLYRADITTSVEFLFRKRGIAIEPEFTVYWQGAERF